jgi:hypothetical protein
MALTITISPDLSELFNQLKTYLDNYVYDIKPSAVPDFYEMTLSGTGATPYATVRITDGENNIAILTADGDGEFEYTFRPDYAVTNRFQAICEDVESRILVIDTYRYLLILYYYAKEYLSILQAFAQAKQSYYLFSKVGDSLEDKFHTEQNVYTTALSDLKDKMPIELPLDIWNQTEDPGYCVAKAIEISEKGPVHASLYALKDVFQGAGCQAVFLYPYENYNPMDLDYTHLPRRHPTTTDVVMIEKGCKKRYGWSVESITNATTNKNMTMPVPTGSTGYVWLYVDGTRDPDGTLTVLTSQTQPIPEAIPTTGTFLSTEVETDNSDGDITGIPYQKYVELDLPAFSLSWAISVYDEVGDLPLAELVSRNIVALGAASPTGVVSVEYDYFSEPMILCVVKTDVSGNVIDVLRTWGNPGHISTCYPHSLANLEVYFKFNYPPNEEVVVMIKNVLNNIRLIPHPMLAFVTASTNDQEVILEDSAKWSSLFKGFSSVGQV